MSSDRLNVKVVSNQNSVELTKNENTVVISDKKRDTSISVLQKETAVVTVASKGPKGDKGDKGDTGIAVTNQITTGSITASVDIGTDTFKVQSGSSTFFNINSSGNVGIGVANPTLGLLQVGTITNPHANVYISAGNTGTSSLTVRAINGFSGHQRTYNPVGGSDSLNFIQLLDGDTTSATDQPIGRIIFSSNDTDSGGTNTTKAFIEAVSEDATPDTFLAFGTAQASTSVTERMRITSVGNVGIGTTTPTNTLQVNGGITSTYLTTSYIDINTTAGITQPIEGRLSWDNTDGTLDIGLKGGNIALQVGQEQVVRVVNKTDGNLLKSEYKVVRIRRKDEGGAQGQRLAIKLSQANNDPNSVDTLGLVAEDIDNNQEGYIITSGFIHNINTTGTLQSETWSDGDVLYLSPTEAGALTNIKPIAPNHTIIVGFVVHAQNNQGKIFVKVDNGYEIDELHNVRINTSSLAVGDLLIYSSSVWINSKQMTGSYVLNGNVTVTGTASINTLVVNQTQLSTGSNQLGDNIDDTQTLYGSVIIPTGSLTVTGSLNVTSGITGSLFGTSSTTSDIAPAITNNTNNRVLTATGGGTINGEANLIFDGGTLGVVGDVSVDGNVTAVNTVDTTNLSVNGYVNTDLSPTDATYNLTLGESSRTWNQVHVGTNDGTRTAFFGEDLANNPGKIAIRTDNDLIIRANGGLDIQATTTIPTLQNDTLTNNVSISTPSLTATNLRATNSASIGGNFVPQARLHISGANNNTLLEIDSPAVNNILFVSGSGRVGIGTGTPSTTLQVAGTSSLQNIIFDTHNTYDIGTISTRVRNIWSNGSIVGVGGTFNNLTTYFTASIGGGASGFTPSANLHVSGASNSNLLRVSSPTQTNILFVSGSGNIGVGTTSPTQVLDVSGSIALAGNVVQQLTNLDIKVSGTQEGRALRFIASSAGARIQAIGSTTSNLSLSTTVASSEVTRMTILEGGNVGIGETSPSARLEIRGSGATSATTALRVGNSNASASLTILDDGTSAFNTSHLYVSSSGLVGVGTALPTAKFHISGANADALFRASSPTTTGLFVSGSGNVGIGTTSPQRRLHIDASGSANTNIPLLLTSVDASNRVGILFASSSLSAGRQHSLFNRVSTPTAEWLLGTNAGETAQWNFIPRDDTNYAITLRTPFNGGTAQITTGLSQSLFSLGAGGTANQHLNISSSGRVGIGTTTPRELLHVAGGNIALDATRHIDWGTGNSRITDLGLVSGQGYPITISTFGPIAAGAPNNLTEKLRLTGSGSLGLGTTNPLSRLHVSGSDGNDFFRITSGSQNILNVRSGSAVFFAGTGVAPTSGFDLDIQGTGTAFGGSVRIAGAGTTFEFKETSLVQRTSTGNTEMLGMVMGGTINTGIQNPLRVQFDANQSSTAGYTVLRLNATHTSVGTGNKLLQTWEFGGTQRSVVNITGSIGVGITRPSASIHISSSLGLPPMLTITPHDPLPTTNIPTGTFMVSASSPPRPYMWDGTSWYAL